MHGERRVGVGGALLAGDAVEYADRCPASCAAGHLGGAEYLGVGRDVIIREAVAIVAERRF
jgi:hypothetical protein